MTGYLLTLLFTAAGIAAALVALRLAGDSAPVRWLARGFCLLALANLAFRLWPVIAADPSGTARIALVTAAILLAVIGYARLLRAARRASGSAGRCERGGGRE